MKSLRVPPEHTDHSFYIRYEGPGWESDKVGYRFYLNWRNASDIFGKKTPEMVLQNVGQDGFDSYHAMADWGESFCSRRIAMKILPAIDAVHAKSMNTSELRECFFD